MLKTVQLKRRVNDYYMKKKIIVGITGASGVSLGIKMLETLKKLKIETHVVLSEQSEKTMKAETKKDVKYIVKSADYVYEHKDFFASIASGSFKTDGMIIIPCSMKTLAGVASGFSSNLLLRAADVILKERRKLVLVARETPLSLIHIENMKTVTLAGGIVLPPVMTWYSKAQSVEDMETHIIGKALDALEIDNSMYKRWE